MGETCGTREGEKRIQIFGGGALSHLEDSEVGGQYVKMEKEHRKPWAGCICS